MRSCARSCAPESLPKPRLHCVVSKSDDTEAGPVWNVDLALRGAPPAGGPLGAQSGDSQPASMASLLLLCSLLQFGLPGAATFPVLSARPAGCNSACACRASHAQAWGAREAVLAMFRGVPGYNSPPALMSCSLSGAIEA